MRRIAPLLFFCAQAVADEPLGFLHVDRDDVSVPLPDRGFVFKVGNTGHLFQLKDDVLIVYYPIEGVPENLYCVRWDKRDAPAWVSNERQVTFGKVVATAGGALLLDKDETLPVIAMGQRDFRVMVQRFGNSASVDIRRDTPGLRFESQLAGAKPAGTVKTGPTHTMIEGSGSSITIHGNGENETPVPPAVPVPTQQVAVVVQPPPPVVPPAKPVEKPPAVEKPDSEKHASAPPDVPLPGNVRWPSLLEDRTSMVVIAVFLVLLIVLLLIQRRVLSRRDSISNKFPQDSAAAMQMKMKSKGRGTARADETFGDQQKLRFVSSKKNQTVILGQQNLVGSPLSPGGSASDTSIIPSPQILPDRRTGGVLWIGKYQVEQLLGRGRMGVVYKAFQQDLNRSVALKLLAEGGHATQKQKDSFMLEAQAIAKLKHPNIVTVYEVGDWEGQPYFTMDYIDGKSMDKMIVKQRFPPREAARLVQEIAEAVEYAHTVGIIHRDLKPGNIILNSQGEPVITDFGLARKLDDDSQTAGDDILGTPAYMSPEQARGRSAETDARSDVYSTGAILYAMLTGEDPFSGSSLLEILHKVIHDKPVAPEKFDPQIDSAIAGICMKALSKDPKRRQQSAGELAADLARYLQILASGQVPASASTKTGLFGRLFARGT